MAKKVLVVDDEPNIVKMMESRLKANGYEVIVAVDGLQCLDKVKAEKPDLIILDVMLPQMNGYDVCRTLRADQEHKSIPIVMLTARGEADDIMEGMAGGADAYVAKPYNADTLLGIVCGLLGK